VAYIRPTPEQLGELAATTLDECLEKWKHSCAAHDAGGQMINYPWDLVRHNAEQLEVDFTFWGARSTDARQPAISIVGPQQRLHVEPTAQLDPYVVADTRQGPIIIDHKAVVTAFTRLEGPCYIGPGTHVVGAKVRGGTTLGAHCRIGGEVEASIVQGYSNKYHDGFLGHAYVGEWVNLGAGTHNSDLRNDYGQVSVTVNGQATPTGQTKVGCFLGDHTKTGLGTLINTGTNAGIFCNLLPAGPLAPKYLPSFTTWWNGELRESLDWWRLLDTARNVMHRRGCDLTDTHIAVYRHVFEETVNERRRTIREMEQRRLRRSA
jgi:UDP-N-acetylglucosamine diphosphorylase/glucosamine-1-phosphate N-acetyltransferase